MSEVRRSVIGALLGAGVIAACSRSPNASTAAARPAPTTAPASASGTRPAEAAPAVSAAAVEPPCDPRRRAAEKREGWTSRAAKEIAHARSGRFEVEATVEDIKPGYDCGGAPDGCNALRGFEATAVGVDGTHLTVRAGNNEQGNRFVAGIRYLLSIATCVRADSPEAAPQLELRAFEVAHREKGADAACVASAPVTGKLASWPSRALPDLARHLVSGGGFNTDGFVVRQFVPVPCPHGAVCKPQPPPYIVLGDAPENPKHSVLLETPEPKSFQLRSRLRASIVVCNAGTYGGVLNEGVLHAFVSLP